MCASDIQVRLDDRGFVVLPGRYETPDRAWAATARVVDGPLEVVADYTMPPPGTPQRDFQVLHIDFGIPLGLTSHTDVARYTALYVDAAAAGSHAATRIVPLTALKGQRNWPGPHDLATRLRERRGDPDRTEGILARIVEAADQTRELPDKTAPTFQCGLEFGSIEEEQRYFANHGIDIAAAEHRVILQPGQCLIFDNLKCAHGRLGVRATAELHQHCLGYRRVCASEQETILLRTVALLSASID